MTVTGRVFRGMVVGDEGSSWGRWGRPNMISVSDRAEVILLKARPTLSHFWISSPVPSKTFLRSLLVASGATLPIKIFTGFLMSEKMAQYHGSKVSYMLESSTFSHLPLYESPSSFLTAFSAPFGVVQYIHQLKYMLWSTKSSHYYLLIIHVNKSDWLVRQFVGLRDIAIPGVWRLFKTIQE